MGVAKTAVTHLLSRADVKLDGGRAWDITVRDPRFYSVVLGGGSIGFGEAYMDGLWDCADLAVLIERISRSGLEGLSRKWLPGAWALDALGRVRNRQSRRGSLKAIRAHYDLDNELFFAFLGRHKSYSCGYFSGTDDLDQAQINKLDLICRKLDLSSSDHLLDVGGGWGAFARHAATRYGCHVTSINISQPQIEVAREHCRGADVEVVCCDYRNLEGRYDKIASVAMLPHVGPKNLRQYMQCLSRCLRPHGSLLIETSGSNNSQTHTDPWLDKYIFPGAVVPSLAQIDAAAEGLFVLEDLHNFAPHYVTTLAAWDTRLRQSWPSLQAVHDQRVRRMFEYYFGLAAGGFRARILQYWHLLYTKTGRAQPPCRIS